VKDSYLDECFTLTILIEEDGEITEEVLTIKKYKE